MTSHKPIIIPRAQHPISRSMLSPNAVRVLYRLRDNGFIAYLVGGCVRDLLLGREPKDFDVVTNATPNQIKRLFRNCRLIGRRFRLAHLHFGDEIIEVATFRAPQADEPDEAEAGEAPEVSDALATERRGRPLRHLKSEEGMVLRDNVFGTPEQDAVRRDFTVNALAYNIDDFSIIDHVAGMADLQAGMIRTIGDPQARFTEDPVRMLRAVRFAAMLGFTMEAQTWRAVLELAPTITRAAPARLYEEVLKLLLMGEGEKTCQMLRQTGLFTPLFPDFSSWLERETEGFPHTGLGHALEWVDSRIQKGDRVEPPLLLALMFGEYLEEKCDSFRRGGVPSQQSVDMAVAELMGELAPTITVPNRIGGMVRQILAYQHRLRKVPGRNPLSFIARPGFSEALEYLRFTAEVTGEGGKVLAWWERFVSDNPLPAAVDGEQGEPPAAAAGGRRKRRRRRRRPAGAEA